jgi:nitrogen-specific signal transduction histidine kinase
MIPPPGCIIYSQDPELVRRVKAYTRSMADLRHVSKPERFEPVLEQCSPAVVIVDLRAKQSSELIDQVQDESRRQNLIIALGVARSEPLRMAEQMEVYATEDLEVDRRRFQSLLARAFEYLKVLQENRDLRETAPPIPTSNNPPKIESNTVPYSGASSLLRFPRLFRRFDNVDALLTNIVEAVADATRVARLGLFSRRRENDPYRLRAGLRYLPETEELEFTDRDALVRWFEKNGYLIARTNLSQVADPNQRTIMRRALDSLGAEIIVPLYGRGRIIGWMFFGHQLTGQPFHAQDLEMVMMLCENVSTVLENAMLHEQVGLQKTLAETLLKSVSPGVVAVDCEATVRWINAAAERLLGVSASTVLNKTVGAAGSRLAGVLREALDSNESISQTWTDHNTRREVSVEARRLVDGNTPLGAVAIVHDLTTEENLRDKQTLLDRATFWTDLAASMSHEIRNPLVAIKTFAQLLPERFDDADFRQEFNQIVVKEIDRLDKIITQINNFAHPAEIVLKPIDVRAPLKKAIEIARDRFGVNGHLEIEMSLPKEVPRVLGDENALAEAFAHLVANAAEASSDRNKPRVTLSVKSLRERGQKNAVLVSVRDNGKGIAPELKEKIFSPFCTTKPRGMGLGLPIVKRTVFDHHGRVQIDSSSAGTLVNITLPATGEKS